MSANPDRKTVDNWYRSFGFNIPEQEQPEEQLQPSAPMYCQYEILHMVLHNRHRISPEALDFTLCSLLDFNTAMQRAFTFPKTISECYNGYPIRIATEVC